jgi:hypothetical protein
MESETQWKRIESPSQWFCVVSGHKGGKTRRKIASHVSIQSVPHGLQDVGRKARVNVVLFIVGLTTAAPESRKL